MFRRTNPTKFAEMIANNEVETDVFYNVVGHDKNNVYHDDL